MSTDLAPELPLNLILCWNAIGARVNVRNAYCLLSSQEAFRKLRAFLKGETIMPQETKIRKNAWRPKDEKITCRIREGSTQYEDKFLHAKLSEFHDEQLEQVTNQINGILEEVAESSHGRGDLSILETPDGLLLAWTQSSDEGDEGDDESALDDVAEIRKFLGISAESNTSGSVGN